MKLLKKSLAKKEYDEPPIYGFLITHDPLVDRMRVFAIQKENTKTYSVCEGGYYGKNEMRWSGQNRQFKKISKHPLLIVLDRVKANKIAKKLQKAASEHLDARIAADRKLKTDQLAILKAYDKNSDLY